VSVLGLSALRRRHGHCNRRIWSTAAIAAAASREGETEEDWGRERPALTTEKIRAPVDNIRGNENRGLAMVKS